MCRFVTRLGRPAPLRDVVFGGGHSLWRQSFAPKELLSGSVNADGWGVVWYADDGLPVRLARPEPIWFETDLERVLEVVSASLTLAAVRNATPGIPRTHEGTPPVVYERWSFILNGFVPDFRSVHRTALQSELPEDQRGALQGTSDTETLFHMAVARTRAGASPAEALADVVEAIGSRAAAGGVVHLNMALADGESVAATRWSSEGPSNSLYRSTGGAWGGTVASEALDGGPEWESVPDGSVVELRRDSAPRVSTL